jgi:hypothetical protein
MAWKISVYDAALIGMKVPNIYQWNFAWACARNGLWGKMLELLDGRSFKPTCF